MMALRTVLTCLSVVPGNVHQKSADYFYLELAPYFPSLILSLWTAGPPVTLQKHLLTSAIVCSPGGWGGMLCRWDRSRAVLRQFCASFMPGKKEKIGQESQKETGHGDWFGISRITSEKQEQTWACYLSMPVQWEVSLIKMKRCTSGLPPAAAGRAKTTCPHSHFCGVTMGWCAKHFSGLSCLQCESAAGGKEVEPAPWQSCAAGPVPRAKPRGEAGVALGLEKLPWSYWPCWSRAGKTPSLHLRLWRDARPRWPTERPRIAVLAFCLSSAPLKIVLGASIADVRLGGRDSWLHNWPTLFSLVYGRETKWVKLHRLQRDPCKTFCLLFLVPIQWCSPTEKRYAKGDLVLFFPLTGNSCLPQPSMSAVGNRPPLGKFWCLIPNSKARERSSQWNAR